MWFVICVFFLSIRRPPRSTRTDTLFPYTTLFRSVAGTRRLGLRPGVCIPALLPVGQPGLGFAQGFLRGLVAGLQLRQFRFGRRDRTAQFHQPRFVAADVAADLGQRRLRLVARTLQALRHFALVGDLLFDPGQGAADLVNLGLGLVQGFAGFLAADAIVLDPALGLALFGDQLLQLRFILVELLAQALQARIEAAVLQRLPLRVLDPALGLDGLILLGLARLALEVLELLAYFVAQVGQALEVLAGVADTGFGFLAPLLVLGDAGGLLQVHAQVLGPGLDDLADHALLDDRVAARAQARSEEHTSELQSLMRI